MESHRPDLSDCPAAKRDGPRAPPAGKRIGEVADSRMGRILVRGEPGNAIVPALSPRPGEKIIHKPGKGAFYGTDLANHLSGLGITHLVICGVTTEVCVQSTMREANDRGFECVVLEDCTASYFPAYKQATLSMIAAQGGIVGYVAESADLLPQLPGSDGGAAGAIANAFRPGTIIAAITNCLERRGRPALRG